MIDIQSYHRPSSIEEALDLLSRPGVRTALVAGGTTLIPQDKDIDDLIDIQALGLDEIEPQDDEVRLGAMCRLQAIVENPAVPHLIQTTARWEGPNTIRNAGTLGGICLTADWESELFAALLVYEATINWLSISGKKEVRLSEFRQDMLHDGLVTSITIQKGGESAGERIARTPADKPIVSVVGRKDEMAVIRLAACGIADRPILFEPDQIEEMNPPGDFRGSSGYRRQMVGLLSQRVLTQLKG